MKKNEFACKKNIFKSLPLLLILFMVQINAFSENEPNNSIETANILSLNGSISGSFSNADYSSDYFKITTPSDGKLTIQVSSDAGLCVSLSVLNSTGGMNLYNNGSCGTGSYSNTLTINNLAAGTYYIWAGNSGNGNYSISNSFQAAALSNDAEPNDEAATALSFAPNSEKAGHLGYRELNTDYYDCYKITTPADGKLSIHLSADNSLCIDLSVYNESGSQNLYSNGYCSGPSHSNTLDINNLAAGTYIILASAVGYGTYTISNTLTPAPLAADAEPNNTMETALPLIAGSEVTGHLGYRYIMYDDYDFYKIVSTGKSDFKIKAETDSTLCVNMRLLNSTGSMNLQSNGSCSTELHTDSMVMQTLPEGTYYLEIGSVGYGSYTIKTSFGGVSGINPVEHSMNEDLLVFPNPARNEISFSTKLLTNPTVTIFDISGLAKLIKPLNAPENYCTLDVSNLSQGIYFIELKQNDKILTGRFIKE